MRLLRKATDATAQYFTKTSNSVSINETPILKRLWAAYTSHHNLTSTTWESSRFFTLTTFAFLRSWAWSYQQEQLGPRQKCDNKSRLDIGSARSHRTGSCSVASASAEVRTITNWEGAFLSGAISAHVGEVARSEG